MFVDYRCVCCRGPLRVLECHRGKALRCPVCASEIVVPLSLEVANVKETKLPSSPPLPQQTLLPWALLMPLLFALAWWTWMGRGVLWAALGVGLGGFCLLLGQRSRWPMSRRIVVSLSLALLGHGLTLAAPTKTVTASPAFFLTPQPVGGPIPVSMLMPGTNGLHSQETEVKSLVGLCREAKTPFVSLDLQFVAQVGDLLAATSLEVANGKGGVVVAASNGTFRDFSCPDFRLRATYQLKGIAYRIAADGRHGLLWAAVCPADKLRANRHGDQPLGRADLHAYELPRAANGPLLPRRVVPLGGDVLELLIAPDQSALFYLAQTDEGVQLGRIDTAKQTPAYRVPLPAATRALCQTADGRTLYAAGGGRLSVLDPATLRTRQVVDLPLDAYALAADEEGCVYLAEQGQWTKLTRLDLRDSPPTPHQWKARMHGRVYLKMSPDRCRLYVGSSSLISDGLESLVIRGHPGDTPLLLARTLALPQKPVHGEFFITPDGRYLLNRWGSVFRLECGCPCELAMLRQKGVFSDTPAK